MSKVVCRECGEDYGFYRNVEVSGTGWVNAQIDGQDDGTVSATTDSYIQEVHYDEGAKYETEWGCSNCGHEAHVLEKLVKVADEEIDEALQRERNPIPGQLRIEVGQ